MIHVAYGLYDKIGRYAKFTGVSMLSLFDNTKSEVMIHLLHDNTLTEENKSKLQDVADRFNRQIKFYNVEVLCADRISYFKENFLKLQESRFSFGTMFRLVIPNLIDAEIDKIIYLDSDTIVNLDIAEFWNLELGDKIFAVVSEKQMGVPTELSPICFDGLVKVEDYFNAGVLLIDLNRLRNEIKTLENGIKFIAENPRYYFFDQDILNYTFSTRTLKLPNRFNRHVGYARSFQDFSTPQKKFSACYSSPPTA